MSQKLLLLVLLSFFSLTKSFAGSASGIKSQDQIANKALHNTEFKSKAQMANPVLHNTIVKAPAQIANPSLHNTAIKTQAQIADPTLHNTEFQHPVTATNYILPETYGAKGDGITDDSSSIQQACARAASVGNASVLFSPKTYASAQPITANGITLVGTAGATLLFTNASSNGILLGGNAPSLSNLVIDYASSGANSGVGIYINGATNFVLNALTINGCPADNIDCISSGPGSITNCLINSSNATSLLIKDGTAITVNNNKMPTFGVITKTAGSSSLTITNNMFTSAKYPPNSINYGVKLAGLTNSTFSNNTIACGVLNIGSSFLNPTNMAFSSGPGMGFGITGSDGSVSHLTVSGNTIDGTNTNLNTSFNDRLGISVLSQSSSAPCDSITISGNTVSNFTGALSAIDLEETVSNSNISGNTITSISNSAGGIDYQNYGIYVGSSANNTVNNNTLTNLAGTAIFFDDGGDSGSMTITNNTISNACIKEGSVINDNPIIDLQAPGTGVSSITITGNTYEGPTANQATYFIESIASSSSIPITINSNTQTSTALPNHTYP